jgi:ribulose-5-phosphate 4-epimerase/fuculose-1-phosphate aldolase
MRGCLGAEEGVREEIARACRMLVHAHVLDGILGHVSVRHGDGLLVRCRGPRERGLLASTAEDVHLVGLDGTPPADPVYRAPNELAIHTSILRARQDVGAVVHAHPPFALLAGLARLDLVPLIGAYDIPAMELASSRIPTYPRAVLVDRDELGEELLAAMGTARACLLRGHGVVTVGATLEEAVVTAVTLERLCRVTVELAQLGVTATPISDEDRAQLPDLGADFHVRQTYAFLGAQLDAAGG